MSVYAPLHVDSRCPERVFLYGGTEAGNGMFRGLLEEAGIEIAGTIGAAGLPEVAAVDIHAAQCRPEIPTVIMSDATGYPPAADSPAGRDGDFAFRDALLALSTQGVQNILHPSFVLDFLKTPLSRAAFVNGLPGAGNILSQRIIKTIIEHYIAPYPDREVFIQDLARNYAAHFCSFVTETMSSIGKSSMTWTSYGVGFANYPIQFADGLVHLCDFRNRAHRYEIPYANHQHLDRASLAPLEALGFRIFLCARHPFDLFLSALHKARIIQTVNKSAFVPEVRAEQILGALHFAAGHFTRAFAAVDDIFVVRYEDLTGSPVETVMAIGRHLGVEIPPAEAGAIWQEYAGRPLPDAPESHFRRGKTGGWRTDLDPDLARELASAKPFALFRDLGYTVDEIILPLNIPAFREAASRFSPQPLDDRSKRKVGDNLTRTVWVESPHRDVEIAWKLRDRLDTRDFRLLCDCAEYQAR